MLRVRVALLSGGLALGAVLLGAHASSVSFARIEIADRTLTDTVRLPLDDIDLLLRLDRDIDGHVSPAELDAARDAIGSYLTKHLRVTADGDALTPTVGAVTTWRDPSGFEYLEARITIDAGRRMRVVSIGSDYLTELYPAHTTRGEVAASGHHEPFVFKAGATYERRVADERWTAPAIVIGGVAIVALLWFVRRPRRSAAVAAMLVLASEAPVRADVIMTAAGLNTTLKAMERLTGRAASGPPPARAEAMFQLGAQADALATLMNQEVESHGMEQRELIELALSRTKELGVTITYNRDKKKFFYDGAAFRQYLAAAPKGAHAVNAEFTLLAYEFYQSEGSDLGQLLAAADAKKRFLARHPSFKGNAELSLYLAVDYRDLYVHYRDAAEAASAEKYRLLTRAEYQRIARQYAGTEQADSARQLLRRFDEQARSPR